MAISREFEIFKVTPNSERLKEFRESFVKTLECPTLYKVLSSNPNWFYYRHGIYDVNEELMGTFFQFGMSKLKEKSDTVSGIFQEFVNKGCSSTEFVKGIRYEGEETYIYSLSSLISKIGRNYTLSPVIPINRDLYNLFKIELGDFMAIEENDLRQYSEFFKVSDKPIFVTTQNRLRESYNNAMISYPEYLESVKELESKERLIKSLRK